MSDEQELKPCPFCGGEAETSSGCYNDETWAYVRCADCDGGFSVTCDDGSRTLDEMLDKCIQEWNRRTNTMNEKQTLMIRACGSVYMEYVIEWATYKSYFRVSCGTYEEQYESARCAEVRFESMCEQERKRS